jgi:hypothetical protein
MSDRLPMPAAMPAEIAERLSDVTDRAQDLPNFADEDDYQGVVNPVLHEPMAALFSTRDQIRVLQRSAAFSEVVNHKKALEWLMNDLASLEHALRRVWEEA